MIRAYLAHENSGNTGPCQCNRLKDQNLAGFWSFFQTGPAHAAARQTLRPSARYNKVTLNNAALNNAALNNAALNNAALNNAVLNKTEQKAKKNCY